MTTRDFVRRAGSSLAANRRATAVSPRGTNTPPSIRAQLAAAREEIANLAAQRYETESAMRALREAVEARDSFIAIAGIELRNPMSAIALGVSNLAFQARRSGDVPAWVGDRLDSIERRTRDFVRRSTTMLDVSRLASQRHALVFAPANLTTIVEAAAREVRPEGARAGCELRLDLEPEVTGSWDAAALEQIALSLLSNAVRFGAGAPVDVSVRSDDEGAVLEVRDGGPGIADIDRDRIFESFERAIAARESPGFGLGLWIARQLVRAHGGELAVASAPGAGSVFTVSFPRHATHETSARGA